MDKFIEFRNKMISDGKLAEEYGEVIKRRSIAKGTKFSDLDDSAISEMIDVARRGGFVFTLDEVRKYFAGNSQGELSDTELESVAGGKGEQSTLIVDIYRNEENKPQWMEKRYNKS
ncbi:MAG: hypothetical protein LBS75_10230 [Synergistaceae bacterium]|jgi:hypothetical protein|nr:hypothetical protein [Synergistaceae bacterium]